MTRREVLRATLLSAILLPALVYLALYAYIVAWTGMTVGQALPRIPLCLLVLLVGWNALCRGPLERLKFSPNELRLTYALTGVALAACGVGYAMSIVPTLGGGLVYYSSVVTPEWSNYLERVPQWAMVRDPAIVERFFLGHSTLYRPDHLRALAVPVFAWVSFLGLLLFGQQCLSEILKDQWLRKERLTFPLVFLPLELTADQPRLHRSTAMWVGFSLAALLNLVNGLNYLYPSLPEIRTKVIRFDAPVNAPWLGLGRLVITFYPFVIGIGYLLSTEVSLSMWLFHWLAKLQMVVAVALGFRSDGSFPSSTAPYLLSQGAGAFLAFALLALWRLKRPVLNSLAGKSREVPRWSVIGLVLCTGGLVWFGRSAGVPISLMVLWLAVLWIMGVAVARLVGEAGVPLAMTPIYPQQFLFETIGNSYGPRDWSCFTLFRNPDELYTDFATVHILSGYRLLGEAGEQRKLAGLFYGIALFGLLAGIWVLCDIYFREGLMNVKATWPDRTQAQAPWRQLDGWLRGGVPHDGRTVAAGLGMLVTAGLVALRQHVLWWPVHPIGYAVGGSYAIEQLWLPFLIAWALKVFTLRAGGLKLYRRMLPAALGLILGDILVPQIWTVVGVILNQPMYFSFPS